MNITTVFRLYVQRHYSHLNDDEWILDDVIFRREQLKSEHLKRILPDCRILLVAYINHGETMQRKDIAKYNRVDHSTVAKVMHIFVNDQLDEALTFKRSEASNIFCCLFESIS